MYEHKVLKLSYCINSTELHVMYTFVLVATPFSKVPMLGQNVDFCVKFDKKEISQ